MKRRTLLTGLAALPLMALPAMALPVMAATDPWRTPERLAVIADIEAAITAPGRGLIWIQGAPRVGKTALLERLAARHGERVHSIRTIRARPQGKYFLDYDSFDCWSHEGCLIGIALGRVASYRNGKVIVASVDSPLHGRKTLGHFVLPAPALPIFLRT